MKLFLKFLCLIYFAAVTASCTGIKNSQYYEYLSTSLEVPECLTVYDYLPAIKLSGTASFFKRGVNLVTQFNSTSNKTELKNLTLGDPLKNALPIRYAEVVVYNSQNKIVQCGRTDGFGFIKAVDSVSNLYLPATADTYSVQVLSRTHISFNSVPSKPIFALNVAVKKDKYTNTLYTLSERRSSNGVDDLSVDLIAYARQTESTEINGGAFNILNSIYTAYSYIGQNTGTVDTQCLSQKIDTYWKAGFNPFQYIYPHEDPGQLAANSYYDGLGDKSLNFSGGRLGNTSLENTDHFDDYVIIHELGHFIEDHCGQLTSPGGNHSILSRIDPRLAWSEGWSNYLAAHIMYDRISEINPEFEGKMFTAGFTSNTEKRWSFFSSTIGYSDSQLNIGNGSGFMFDLKKSGSNPDAWQWGKYEGSLFDRTDASRYPGEGHFREGSITRGFFKLTNACGVTCALTPLPFENVWKAFDRLTGVGTAGVKFKSSHTVLENIKLISGGSWNPDIQTKAESEALHLFSAGTFSSGAVDRWIPYGTGLATLSSSACPRTQYIEPRSDDPILTSTNSDQRYSNHFYTLDMTLFPGLTDIKVTFAKQNISGTATEFDLLLFTDDYVFNGDYSCSVIDANGNCSTTYKPSRTTTNDVLRSDRRSGSTLNSKRITLLNNLDPTKKYLLNIRAYTAGRTIASVTDYSYSIEDGLGNHLCP